MAKFPGVGTAYPAVRRQANTDPSAGKIASNRTVPLNDVLNAKIPGAIDGELVDAVFATAVANSVLTLNHSLKRVPVGFLVVSLKKGSAGVSAFSTVPVVYQKGAATRTTISVACSSAGNSTDTTQKPIAKLLVW